MYHEVTTQQVKQRVRKRVIALCVAIAIVVTTWSAVGSISASLREQSELSVRDAILNSAKQCCAIEGSYPASLTYLEKNYGLVVNRNDYAITYDVFADNVMPNVVVRTK